MMSGKDTYYRKVATRSNIVREISTGVAILELPSLLSTFKVPTITICPISCVRSVKVAKPLRCKCSADLYFVIAMPSLVEKDLAVEIHASLEG
jgi:hypothetical protein